MAEEVVPVSFVYAADWNNRLHVFPPEHKHKSMCGKLRYECQPKLHIIDTKLCSRCVKAYMDRERK